MRERVHRGETNERAFKLAIVLAIDCFLAARLSVLFLVIGWAPDLPSRPGCRTWSRQAATMIGGSWRLMAKN
jgi:hypothetical protein